MVFSPEQEYCREHYGKLYKLAEHIPKYKERAWRDYLQYTLLTEWGIKIEYDKQLQGTSIKPDIHFFLLGVLFIVEIDEFQHKLNLAYDKERDEKRYENLKLFKKTHFIRVNTDKNDKRRGVFNRVSSVDPETKEIVVTMETDHEEFNFRKSILMELLNYLLVKECEDYKKGETQGYFFNFTSSLHIYKLFYD